MFSTDRNIESIAGLVEELKNYVGLKAKYLRLDVVDKVVRIITTLALVFIVMLIAILMLICLSFAGAFALGHCIHSMALGFIIVAAIHLLIIILVLANKKTWIEKPLVRLLAGILLE